MDIISDMLTRIRNALRVRKPEVEVLYSKLGLGILRVLKDEGYIASYEDFEVRSGVRKTIIKLKYYKDNPVIQEIKMISKQSRRLYSKVDEFPVVYNGMGINVVSTSLGILSDTEAKNKRVGGEVICSVF